MKLGLLGPEGTFSEIAARKWDAKAELVFLDDNELVARAVDDSLCDEAIVPIENSVEGPVGVVHDQLLKNQSYIVGEVIIPVRQCLLSQGNPSDIKVILSHPQALGQCRKYLREHYPDAELRSTGSTTHAAKLAQEFPEMAAIGSAAAAEHYGLKIIAKGIQDSDINYTRFIVIGKKMPASTGHDKTSMAVYLDRDRPGALYEFLGEFARRQINMTRIESRPSRLTLGDYWFFIDVEGHCQDGPLKEAIAMLSQRSAKLKVWDRTPGQKGTDRDMIGEILVFLVTYFLIMVRPWKLNEATGALIGALLMLVFLQPHHVLEALGFATSFGVPQVNTWNVIVILVELMVISTFLDDYGFFEWCAARAMQMAGGDARRLFTYTYAVTCLITAITSNDIAILTLTPIVLKFCRRANLDAKPFMFSFFFAANIASMFLVIGNLTNILIGDAFHLGYFDFAAWMFLPTMAAIVVNYIIFRFMFRDSISTRYEQEKDVDFSHLITDRAMVLVGIVVLGFVLVGCGFASNAGLPLSVVTTVGMIAIYIAERKPVLRTRRISWRVVVFVISLFIVVKGLEVGGVNAAIGSGIMAVVGQNAVLATFFISLSSAFMCNVVNNIPMTAMMVPITSGIAQTPDMRLAMAYSLVIGSNLGANITITGALAGILWIETAKAEKWSTGVADFIKIGLTVTPVVILASAAVLAMEIIILGS